MKQGINNKLQVTVDVDLDVVTKIDFKFTQLGANGLVISYPGTAAVLDDDGETINVFVTAADTWKFKPGEILLDTRITLAGTNVQPATDLVKLEMMPTTFARNE